MRRRPDLKLTAMADAGKSDWKEKIVPRDESVLDMIRVAFYAHQVSEAVEMIEHALELGYETTANLMAVSNISETEIDTVLDAIKPTPAGTMVIVDSFGHLYREQIDILYKKYADRDGRDRQGDWHPRPQQHAAWVSPIRSRRSFSGANRADATMGGLGRGAGNCPMELLLGFLRNPKFKLRPVVELLQKHIEPLRETTLLGTVAALQHHRPAESPSASRHQVPGRRRQQELHSVLRRYRRRLLRGQPSCLRCLGRLWVDIKGDCRVGLMNGTGRRANSVRFTDHAITRQNPAVSMAVRGSATKRRGIPKSETQTIPRSAKAEGSPTQESGSGLSLAVRGNLTCLVSVISIQGIRIFATR